MEMKFIFSGNYNGKVKLEYYFIKELRERGNYVNVFDSRKILGIEIGYDWEHLNLDLQSISKSRKFKNYYHALVDFCRNNDVEYYIWWADKLVHPSVVEEIHNLGIKTIGVCGDDSIGNRKYFSHWQPHLDYYLTTDPDNKSPNAKFFNPACVLPYIKKLDIKKDIDVLFYGTLYPNRIEMLNYLKDNGVNVTIYSSATRNEVYAEELNELINRARVTLHIQHPDVKIATLRFFEVMGSESELCTDYFPEEIYPFMSAKMNNRQLTKKELLSDIKYTLKFQERDDVIRAFMEHIQKFTVKCRVDKFLEMIK